MNDWKKLTTACLIAGGIWLGGQSLSARTMLFQESFETDGEGTRYIVIGGGDNPEDPRMAFARRRVGSTGTLGQGELLDGEWMWMARRMTTVPGPRGDQFEGEGLTNRDARLKFPDIDVSGYGDLSVKLVICVGAPGHEPNDDFKMRVRFDGGDWIEIGGFRSSTSNSWPIYYQGPSDTMTVQEDPNKLIRFFTEWEWPIPNHGGEMELQLTFSGNAFNEDWYVDNIRIFGDADLGFFNASFAEGTVVEPEEGGIPNPLTITLDEPAPEGGVFFELAPPDRRTAVSLGLPDEPVFIPQGQTSVEVPVEIVQDGQYTGTKRIDLFVSAPGYSTEFARTFVENVTPRPRLIFTEALNVVPGIGVGNVVLSDVGDVNNDGDVHNTRNQFIELVNIDDHPVDLSGYRIGDDLDDRHLISEGTVLYPNTALVVFGGGNPRGTFGGAIVQTASGGGNGLGLNIASRAEFMYLNAPFGAEVELVNIPLMRADIWAITEELPTDHNGHAEAASFHRTSLEWTEPGFTFEGEHLHSIIEGSNQTLYSPGTWIDGSPFFDPENEITLTVSSAVIREDAGPNAATGTITLAEAAPSGGFEVHLDSEGFALDEEGNVIPVEIDVDSHVVVVPEGDTTVDFRIGAHNDGVLDGDQVISLNARAGPYVLPGFVEMTVLDAQESDYSFVINEIFADPEGSATDMNRDGRADDAMGDQFVEIVNISGRPVNMSGWRLWWDSGGTFAIPRDSHFFPEGTWVPDGGAIVIFGTVPEENLNHPDFGGAIVQGARNANGSLKRNGLDIDVGVNFDMRLDNPHGFTVVMLEQVDGSTTNQDQSITRVPDLEGEFGLHLDASLELFGFDVASPGVRIDGEPFSGNGQVLTPQIFHKAIADMDGVWLWDEEFGWLGLAEANAVDSPWIYSAEHRAWWYVPEAHAGGVWAYDMEVGAWLFTGYGFTPWAWKAANGGGGEWIDRRNAL